ncbi:hypothetical protein EPA93_47915 [Ktedonosporobacter rubrisoli]|uniref:HTH luxR-type domain-containing protein n=1 Tax=Ktedonosporobacter rubrisoli TaxID=2509675 RepID=A0A4P6K4Y6_KTERU|nr:LuxR C-terminal-related transcriptional regulator [Ktedonosporobacter rubrisoli]QBD83284.1 hypothetical protein EPA93_47915 [Ktedonosporobacter rubrisoli]
MTRTTQAALIWLQEQQQYLWHDIKRAEKSILPEATSYWHQRLALHTSFSFQGKEGQLTLLNETRPRGKGGYWYAYRHVGKRTTKKYVGRTDDITFARLESAAKSLLSSPEKVRQAQNKEVLETTSSLQTPSDTLATDLPQQHNSFPYSLQDALLIPKLHLPQLHPSLILREGLLTLLDKSLEHRLTLISAPAGFGKTTLVGQWIARHSKEEDFPPVAWVSLDPGDNDPVRFWRYLTMACQTFHKDLVHTALSLLHAASQAPFEPRFIESALTTLLNSLSQSKQRGILILDDYQVITSPRLQETVTFFLDYLPAGLHVLLISRHDPPLPLIRLRARNDLFELRTSALRFTQEETASFLQSIYQERPAAEIVQYISMHLEGWAAGHRLLQVALREPVRLLETKDSLISIPSQCAGKNGLLPLTTGNGYSQNQKLPTTLPLWHLIKGPHAFQEYFLAEVFNAQPEPLQQFLLQTSVLSRLTAQLCTAVTGINNSQYILETLEHANLFLEALDSNGTWFRYHGPFAEAMQAEARPRLGDDRLRIISARACRWYEEHNLYTDAIEAALQAQDHARAADLIERHLAAPYAYQQAKEYHTLYRWLGQLPEALLQQHPTLCLTYVTALLSVVISPRLTPSTELLLSKFLQMAEQSFRAEANLPRLGEVFALRALVAWRQDDAIQAAHFGREALSWLKEEQTTWRSLSLSVVGKAELLFKGNVHVAQRMLEEALALCETAENRYFKLRRTTANMLGTTFFEQGKLHLARKYYQQALVEAREQIDSGSICHSLLGLGRICYEHNELDIAQQQAEEVKDIGHSLAYEFHEVQATLLLTRIQHARGESKAALQHLNALLTHLQTAQPYDHASPLFQDVLTWQVRLSLSTNDLATVQHWTAASAQFVEALPPFSSAQRGLVIARAHYLEGREEVALATLQALLNQALPAGHQRISFEAQALLALVYEKLGKSSQARQTLHTLLAQTYAEGYLRPFLDEGETMARLLSSLLRSLHKMPLRAYLQGILQAFPQGQAAIASLPEPLSRQERRVLQLLADERSNAEIAHAMVVSINTIRTQTRSIYRKLGVHNRSTAVAIARQLRLL